MVSKQAQVILQLGQGSGHMFLTLLFISHGGESGLRALLTLLSPFLLVAIRHSRFVSSSPTGLPLTSSMEESVQ